MDICSVIKKQTVMQHFTLIIVMLISSLAFSQATNTQDIVVTITNFESNEGKALIGLFDSESTFLKERFKSHIVKIENNSCKVTFKNIPVGVYAVSIVHDENDNGKLDTNFMGIPKEDTGCSNNAPARFGPPKWEDAKFEVKNETISQSIKL